MIRLLRFGIAVSGRRSCDFLRMRVRTREEFDIVFHRQLPGAARLDEAAEINIFPAMAMPHPVPRSVAAHGSLVGSVKESRSA